MTAVVCPHPPLLLPGASGGSIAEVEQLRATCRSAVAALLAGGPASLAVVGAGAVTRAHRLATPDPCAGAGGYGVVTRPGRQGMAPAGVAVGAPDGATGGDPSEVPLPLSLAVARCLLTQDLGADPVTTWLEVAADETPGRCARLGAELAATHDALMVLADASTRRGSEPPGGPHEAAEAFDTALASALQQADPVLLAGLDPTLAAEVGAQGRAAWQVLAAWADGRARMGDGVGDLAGDLRYHEAPFGVAYLVATWSTPCPRTSCQTTSCQTTS